VNRIKADPSLSESEIRIVLPDGQPAPITPAPAAPSSAPSSASTAAASPAASSASSPQASVPTAASAAPPESSPVEAPELDYRGTRRAARVRISGALEMMVDGNRGQVIDLSTCGAQLVTPSVLKPNQRVRVALSDEQGTIRCGATVVWASFEIPKGASPRYRVGVEFIDPDVRAIERYQQRHGQ
jgi:hypothetical protein